MEMPIGKRKGEAVDTLPSAYLFWLVSQEAIRFRRWELVEEALRVLRDRFACWDDLLAGMRVVAPPPEYWKPRQRAREKAIERERKLLRMEKKEEFPNASRAYVRGI
jgi:hypothetical protein